MQLPKTRTPESAYRYRGNTPSGDMTQFIKSVSEDIATLFGVINENNDKLNDLQSVANIENRFLMNKIAALEATLRDKDIQLMPADSKKAYINVYNAIRGGVGTEADISHEYHQISIANPIYTPKLYMHDNILNKNIIPPSLSIKIDQKFTSMTGEEVTVQDDTIILKENSVTNAIDGDTTTCWQRAIKVPHNTAPCLVLDVTIPIPYEVISNRNINTVAICPHPVQTVDILNIQVRNGDSWVQIPGFTDHSGYDSDAQCVPDSRPIRLYFNDMAPTEVKITLRQSKSISEADYDIFYIGAYSIEIGYTNNMGTTGDFTSVVELLGDSNLIKAITPTVDNKSLLGDVLRYEIYYINEFDTPVFVSSALPVTIPSKKLMIAGKVVKGGTTIPAINQIEVEYEVTT